MIYKIEYQPRVISEDIPRLDSKLKKRIQNAIETKLVNNPQVFGKPLGSSLKNLRKLRLGDYRVIFMMQVKTVKILAIWHRSKAYKKIRIKLLSIA